MENTLTPHPTLILSKDTAPVLGTASQLLGLDDAKDGFVDADMDSPEQELASDNTTVASTSIVLQHETTKEMKKPVGSTKKEDKEAIQGPVSTLSFCERIPIEVWHEIMSHLPTSHVPASSMTSTTLLNNCRTWSRWLIICKKNTLETPECTYKTHMALVCSQSCYVCTVYFGPLEVVDAVLHNHRDLQVINPSFPRTLILVSRFVI
ncbi:hypothetical protein EDD21DRAFT_420280 [Dissophora ornata]|nr:hypothetical protein EDD21DRAFT_420280 [Dissophora ornata]